MYKYNKFISQTILFCCFNLSFRISNVQTTMHINPLPPEAVL